MTRQSRIGALAHRHAEAFRKARDETPERKVFSRRDRKRAKLSRIIAYDFETTRIKAGTPQPLYITAYGEYKKEKPFRLSLPLNDLYDVRDILNQHFLLDRFNHAKFVAWGGNIFDVYFIAAAMMLSDDYIVYPYLTRGKSLRGVRISPNDPILAESHSWEFLDGMAMLGMPGRKLADFLKSFAPDYLKIEGAINFESEDFDSNNARHVDYAMRDSEGLFHGMMRAQEIVADNFNIGLAGTIGNMGIKIFQSHIPEAVCIREPSLDLNDILANYVMRGGYCYSVRKFQGAVWKYDLNQAYAAAMRDTRLPCGDVFHIDNSISKYADCYIVRIRATNPKNTIPFYHRSIETDDSIFGIAEIVDTWITSSEHAQLISEQWKITILESWNWCETFDMREYVRKLENLRLNAEGGPKSAQGEMIKAIGNNSFGKTVETLGSLNLVMAREKPDGYAEYYIEDDQLSHIWYMLGDPQIREYHQPQLGAMITAHVRMQVRRAILQNPKAWLYADTDCVAFTEPVNLDVHATKYGKWKVESEGVDYIFITKKVYAKADGSEKHAKGLNQNKLVAEDFLKWYAGVSPIQTQNQRNNFVKVMGGAQMYRLQQKTGQKGLHV